MKTVQIDLADIQKIRGRLLEQMEDRDHWWDSQFPIRVAWMEETLHLVQVVNGEMRRVGVLP